MNNCRVKSANGNIIWIHAPPRPSVFQTIRSVDRVPKVIYVRQTLIMHHGFDFLEFDTRVIHEPVTELALHFNYNPA